jgi:hypothetical protein
MSTFTDIEKAKKGADLMANSNKKTYHVIRTNLLEKYKELDDSHLSLCAQSSADLLGIKEFLYTKHPEYGNAV